VGPGYRCLFWENHGRPITECKDPISIEKIDRSPGADPIDIAIASSDADAGVNRCLCEEQLVSSPGNGTDIVVEDSDNPVDVSNNRSSAGLIVHLIIDIGDNVCEPPVRIDGYALRSLSVLCELIAVAGFRIDEEEVTRVGHRPVPIADDDSCLGCTVEPGPATEVRL